MTPQDAAGDWGWTAAEVLNSPGYGSPLAAYECTECGTVVPVHISKRHEKDPDFTLWPTIDYTCGPRWDGCGASTTFRLVSDGFIDTETEDSP